MISLIIPFYRGDYKQIPKSIEAIKKVQETYKIKEVLLCYNGSVLDSKIKKDISSLCNESIKLLSTKNKGIGAGYKLGIKNSTQKYLLLSASDLPFGFTDLERIKENNFPEFAIGSKWAKGSVLKGYGLKRKLFSKTFLFIRRSIFGLKVPKDTQGTIFFEKNKYLEIIKKCKSDDFFFSTEFILKSFMENKSIIEVPIKLLNHDNNSSSVNTLKDSFIIIIKILKLKIFFN